MSDFTKYAGSETQDWLNTELHFPYAKSKWFFPDRPWIWPRIPSVSYELDIAIHMLVSQLSDRAMHFVMYSDVINSTWTQRVRQWNTFHMLIESICKLLMKYICEGRLLLPLMCPLYRVMNTICLLLWRTVIYYECYFVLSKHKIILKWVHKKFATPVDTLFPISWLSLFLIIWNMILNMRYV